MKGRILTSVAISAIGVSLLVAAMLAGSAAGGTQAAAKKQKVGGSLTWLSNRSDWDYVDPRSWRTSSTPGACRRRRS